MSDSIKVSVSMVTYNHEAYIAQAIDSVLMQKFDAPFELVIGDDCSTDATTELVREYAARHPSVIRLLDTERNLGALANFARTVAACGGQYVALLDGDDYWTSPHKIARQVEYLDRHEDCSTCFHTCLEVYEDAARESWEWPKPRDRRPRYTLCDVARDSLGACSSMMFRRSAAQAFPDWFFESPVGDWVLNVMNARRGDIVYIDECMSVHRWHARGMWSQSSAASSYQNAIRTRELFSSLLEGESLEACKEGMFADRRRLAKAHQAVGDLAEARECLEECLRDLRHRRALPRWRIVLQYLLVLAASVVPSARRTA